VGLPGHLFGYCSSAAACMRIQDAVYDDNKTHKNLNI